MGVASGRAPGWDITILRVGGVTVLLCTTVASSSTCGASSDTVAVGTRVTLGSGAVSTFGSGTASSLGSCAVVTLGRGTHGAAIAVCAGVGT